MRSEDVIHKAVLDYLRYMLPHGWIICHPANGGYRTKSEAKRFKGLGVVAGLPDIMIFGRKDMSLGRGELFQPWTGFLEIKTPKGRLSPSQNEMLDRLADCGFPVAVVRSVEDARSFATTHGLPLREVMPS